MFKQVMQGFLVVTRIGFAAEDVAYKVPDPTVDLH